jgi:nucleotide-binding universal stress UspA family protein
LSYTETAKEDFMKILIATDGSEFGDAAVASAAERVWPQGSEFRVLSVIEHQPISYISTGEYAIWMDQVRNELRTSMETIAKEAAKKLEGESRTVSYTIREGLVANEIIDEAKEWNADLILVGTHGRHGLSRFLLGSVAQRVASYAHCSVEIVRLKSKAD